MKKINIFELLSIGILILIGCLIVSIVAKNLLRIDADFLSAAATLFTGVVAYKLFNDWRTQYRTELLERLKDRFSSLMIKLEKEHDLLDYFVDEKASDFKDNKVYLEILDKVDVFSTLIENIVDELDFYEKIYIEFGLNTYIEVTPPTEMIDGLDEIHEELTIVHHRDLNDEDCLKGLKSYLDSRDAADKIIDYKINLSRDLHVIIIDMINDKKGQ